MKKKKFFLAAGFLIILSVLWFVLSWQGHFILQTKKQEQTVQLYPAINGQLVDFEVAQARPIAVVVENHPDSRPQSGLGAADIIYETLAEGGITRFLALFQSTQAENVGPVRSARDYFAELANEWGALFAHVGGSNKVIAQLKNGDYKNLDDANEYYNEQFFHRAAEKDAPHNVFTSTERLKELLGFYGFSKRAIFFPYQFKEDEPASASTTQAGVISIDFSRPGYEVEYQYNPLGNNYFRFLSGEPHFDAESQKQLTAKNIVVQFVEVTPVPDDPLLKVDIKLLGQGKAVIFQDGKVIEGTWVKSIDNPTRFFDPFGREIQFNRGPIWIELLPTDRQTQFNWQSLELSF